MSRAREKSANKLKLISDDDASKSIVVSFEGQWLDPLKRSEIGVFFRRRGPRYVQPDYVYAYVAAPTSAIIGRAPVLNSEWLSVHDALDRAERGKIRRDVLKKYAEGTLELCTITLGKFESFKTPLSAKMLLEKYGVVPPQNFFVLSGTGKATLDKLGKRMSPG